MDETVRLRMRTAHARRGHTCSFCGRVVFGNGGQVSHGRGHVRRGEAVEVVKWHDSQTCSRFFIEPDAARINGFIERGFHVEGPATILEPTTDGGEHA